MFLFIFVGNSFVVFVYEWIALFANEAHDYLTEMAFNIQKHVIYKYEMKYLFLVCEFEFLTLVTPLCTNSVTK